MGWFLLLEAMGIFQNAIARVSIAMVWSKLAACYPGLGDGEKAIESFSKGERVCHETGVSKKLEYQSGQR